LRSVEDFDGDDLATGGIHSDRAVAGVEIERAARRERRSALEAWLLAASISRMLKPASW
jgi:hypothetical protein